MSKLTRLLVLSIVFLIGFALLANAAIGDLITGWALVAPVRQPVAYHRAASAGDKILLVGGEVPVWATPEPLLRQAKVEADGSIVQWATPKAASGVRLPQPLHRHALVQVPRCMTNVLYVIGGFSNGNRYAQVWRADWDASWDQVSGWVEMRNFPRKIILHEALYAHGRIYVLGGIGEDDRPLSEVYSTIIYSNAELAPWLLEKSLPAPLYRFAAAVYTGDKAYLYVTGGYDGAQFQQAIYRTDIGADGKLNEWKTIGQLPRPLAYHRVIIIGNHFIVIGGMGNDGSYNEVYSAMLTTDGKLGAWRTEANLPDSISRFAAIPVMLSNRTAPVVYVIGGTNGDNFRAQVYHSLPLLIGTSASYTTISMASGSSTVYLPIAYHCS